MKKLAWQVIAEQDKHIDGNHGKAFLKLMAASFIIGVSLVVLVLKLAEIGLMD